MPKPKYVRQLAMKSFCPNCNNCVTLLCPRDARGYAWFYICWSCKKIYEVSKGEVTEDA